LEKGKRREGKGEERGGGRGNPRFCSVWEERKEKKKKGERESIPLMDRGIPVLTRGGGGGGKGRRRKRGEKGGKRRRSKPPPPIIFHVKKKVRKTDPSSPNSRHFSPPLLRERKKG